MEWLDIVSEMSPIYDIDHILNYAPKWPLLVHVIAASICFGFSATMHLFFVYSPDVSNILLKLDYSGIIILIFGSAVPFI